MEETREMLSHRLLNCVLCLYILFQPLLDIITSMQTRGNSLLTLGIILRALFMVSCCLYVLLFTNKKSKSYRLSLTYLIILSIYCLLFAVSCYITGGVSGLFGNIKALIKVFYFPYILIGLYILYINKGVYVSNRILSYVLSLYTLVIFIAFLTGTSFQSYSGGKGYTGWFYAANEVGAVVCVLAPIAIAFSLHRLAQQKIKWYIRLFDGFSLLLIIFCGSFIGTKAAFLGITGYLICYFLWNLFSIAVRKERQFKAQTLLSIALLICTTGLYFVSPLKTNIKNAAEMHFSSSSTTSSDESNIESEPTSSQPISSNPSSTNTVSESTGYRILNFVLSNRLRIIEPVMEAYDNSGWSTKLFGLGYMDLPGSPYKISTSVEMDFISLLFRHGIVGLLLYLIPILTLLGIILKFVITHFKLSLSSLYNCTYLYSLILGLLLAFAAGHVLSAPAVSIYIVVVFILLLNEKKQLLMRNNPA